MTNIIRTNPISRFYSSAMRRVARAMPDITVSREKTINRIKWVGKKISSPENRLILGVTALLSQPFIDLHNRNVDEETRKVSAARTVAKIIAGTSTGVFIRWGCIKLIDEFSKFDHEIKKNMRFKNFRKFFTPNAKILRNLDHYKNSLGTILSLCVMVVTNFLIDAPLTKYLTNKFVDKIHKKDEQKFNKEVK